MDKKIQKSIKTSTLSLIIAIISLCLSAFMTFAIVQYTQGQEGDNEYTQAQIKEINKKLDAMSN